MGKYNLKRLKWSSRYRLTKRNKRIAKKLEKFYWEYFTDNTGRMRKIEKMRFFRKKSKIDRKAIAISKKIHDVPYSSSEKGTVKRNTLSIWKSYMLDFDDINCREFKALLSAIRKAIADGFPIENTYLHEIPFANNEMIVADFVNKDDYDDCCWHKKDVDIRSISFECYYDRLFAQPVKDVYEGGSIHSYEVDTCQEAESVWRSRKNEGK